MSNSLLERKFYIQKILAISLLWFIPLIWYIGTAYVRPEHIYERVDYIYYFAAQCWMNSKALYNGTGFGFIYFPTTPFLLAPLAFLKMPAFALLFRIFSLIIFSFGMYRFSTLKANDFSYRTYFYMTLASFLLVQATLHEGQLHLIITGLLLLGYSAIAQEKWWLSAGYLALSLALKPTAIVLYLLAMALYPKVTFRLILTTLIVFSLPFAFRDIHYVINQWLLFLYSFQTIFRFDGIHPQHWATIFSAFSFFTHSTISVFPQFALRIIYALCILMTCYLSKMRFHSHKTIFIIFALGMSYLMLFNTRTENNDYIMIMPMIGFSLAQAVEKKKNIVVIGLWMLIILAAFNWLLCRLITPHNNLWLNPTLISLYTLYILHQIFVQNHSHEKLAHHA